MTSNNFLKKLAIFLVFFCGIYLVSKIFKDRSEEAIQKGELAPRFEIKDKSGEIFSLSAKKGRVVFLNFWASWCQPCLYELPSLKKLGERFKNRAFDLISINTDSQDPVNVQRIIEEYELDFRIAFDRQSETSVQSLYGVTALPTNYIIDKNGLIAEQLTGMVDLNSEVIIKRVEELLLK